MNLQVVGKLFALLFTFILISSSTLAAGLTYGHNLSATSDLVPVGSCSVGLEIIACGVNEKLTIGTSTWLWVDYNMASLAFRGLLHEDAEGNRWALQASYFKTLKERTVDTANPFALYQMEALWMMLVRTLKYNDHYRLHINLHANYYYDEKMPFSLRRPYGYRTPFQFNFSLLHEMELVNGWFILGEVGLLDFARNPTHIHTGASMGQKIGNFSFHVGFSMTGTPTSFFAPSERIDYQQHLRSNVVDGYNSNLTTAHIENDFALHPEFALSYLF